MTGKGAMRQSSVVVVGGGASGLTAAIAAARGGALVTLLEAGERVGRRILASGNGRCNLGNTGIAPEAYNRPDFVAPVLAEWTTERVGAFFGSIGLVTYPDDEGRIYPISNAANSVLDVLRLECAHLGVEERLEFRVASVDVRVGGGFEVVSAGGERVVADAVVVATGGGHSVLSALGHELVPCVPVLGPIRTRTDAIRRLSGIRVKCAASLLASDAPDAEPIATERGELLFRDYGVSGIMIFDLSRHLEEGRILSIDFFPDFAEADVLAMTQGRTQGLAWRTAETFFDGVLHHTLAQELLRAAGVQPDAPVSSLDAAALAHVLKDFRLEVTGRGDAKQSQVTRGGAAVEGFDAETLESRLAPGVFAAGEVLDVDGRCGGFNLHWAWASGLVAGANAARAAAGEGASGDRS